MFHLQRRASYYVNKPVVIVPGEPRPFQEVGTDNEYAIDHVCKVSNTINAPSDMPNIERYLRLELFRTLQPCPELKNERTNGRYSKRFRVPPWQCPAIPLDTNFGTVVLITCCAGRLVRS